MRGSTNIIIPAIELNDELIKCLTEINKINFSNFFVSILLDKNSNISCKLTGIKGQYLYLNKENVFNIRKHQGYLVDFNIY